MTAHNETSAQKNATAFAVRLVGYCHANALTLGGLVAELGADEPLDAIRAARLAVYCDEHSLTLGGMITELWPIRIALIHAEQESQMRVCMANRETYDIASIRDVVAHYETKIGKDSHGAKVARAILAERLAECPGDMLDYAFATDCDEVRRQEETLILVMRLRSLLDMRDDFAKRGKLVLLEQTNALIDALCVKSDTAPTAAQVSRFDVLDAERQHLADDISSKSAVMRELEESGAHDGFVDLIDARQEYGQARDAYLKWEACNAEEWANLESLCVKSDNN